MKVIRMTITDLNYNYRLNTKMFDSYKYLVVNLEKILIQLY